MSVTNKSRSWKTVVRFIDYVQYFKAPENGKLCSQLKCHISFLSGKHTIDTLVSSMGGVTCPQKIKKKGPER